MIREAAEFAAKAHEGVCRKGTAIPYITHPLETAVIVARMTDDEEVIAAALLHDVIEDAGVCAKELEELFGRRVADLVAEESQDKSKTWYERKSATIQRLSTAREESKILALGDKLSNMRSTARDYLLLGDEVWNRFREKDKALHAWYYAGVGKALKSLETSACYQEYCELYQQVFGMNFEGEQQK